MGYPLSPGPDDIVSVIVGPLVGGATLLVLVVFPYVVFERRYRTSWKKLATRRSTTRGGPYRRSVLGIDAPKRAPLLVRAVALLSFLLGGAAAPLATAAFAMLANGEATGLLAFVPALVLARTWIAAARLLDPNEDALRSVRTAARWLAHLGIPLALASVPLWLLLSVSTHEGAALVVALGIIALVLLGESALLARATRAAARLHPEEAERRVLVTPTIPSWMNRLLVRKLSLR